MNNKLYVGNVSYQVNESSLEQTFSSFGKVKSVKIITDRETGRTKGFAFVEMESDEDAQNCITNLDGKELDGRPLRVNIAQDKKDTKSNGRW